MKSLGIAITIFLLFAVFVSSCASPETPSEAPLSHDATIVCEVFYRAGAGGGLEAAPLITFTKGNDLQVFEFETMTFEASFQDDAFEGRAIRIAVTNLEGHAEMSRQLYQFDPQNPVVNQFVGGHGFTGLNYVFQPDTSAEMQYFCSVK